jgi:hypothetical protein
MSLLDGTAGLELGATNAGGRRETDTRKTLSCAGYYVFSFGKAEGGEAA